MTGLANQSSLARKLFDEAESLVEKEDYQGAVRKWIDSIEADPDFSPAPRRLAYFYILLQEYAPARDVCTKRLEMDPEDAELRFYLCISLIHLGEPDAARMLFDTALSLLGNADPEKKALWKKHWRDHNKLHRKRRLAGWAIGFFAHHPGIARLARWFAFHVTLVGLSLYAPVVRRGLLPKHCLLQRRQRCSISRYLRFRARYFGTLRFDMNFTRIAEAALVTETIGLHPGASVVDIGTGTNPLPLYWASHGMCVTCTDPDDFVLRMKPEAKRMGLGKAMESGDLQFQVADGASLPFEDNSFDFWTSVSVVEHIPGTGDSEVLKEAARVLKPGGIAVLTTEGGDNPHDRWMPVDGYFGKQYTDRLDESERSSLGVDDLAEDIADYEERNLHKSFALLREYDRERLIRRLVEPSGLDVLEIGFLDKRFATDFREAIDSPHPPWWGTLLKQVVPLACYWTYRRVDDENYRPRRGATAYAILRK